MVTGWSVYGEILGFDGSSRRCIAVERDVCSGWRKYTHWKNCQLGELTDSECESQLKKHIQCPVASRRGGRGRFVYHTQPLSRNLRDNRFGCRIRGSEGVGDHSPAR